jgi:hypothetical protein
MAARCNPSAWRRGLAAAALPEQTEQRDGGSETDSKAVRVARCLAQAALARSASSPPVLKQYLMPMSSERWKHITPSQFPWEREALDFVRERLPDMAICKKRRKRARS